MAIIKFFNEKNKDEEQQQLPQIQPSPLQKTLFDITETFKNTFPVLKTPLGKTIMSVFIPGLSAGLKLDEQNQKLLEYSGYKPKPIEIDFNKIPLVDLAAKGVEGFVEGSTLGLVDLPFKKSENIAQKLAYGVGNIAGTLSPEGLLSKGASLISKALPIKIATEGLTTIAKTIPESNIIGKIASAGIKAAGEGLPYAGAIETAKVLKGETKSPEEFAKGLASQSKWNLAIGSAFPALALMAGTKAKAIETGEELASKVAREFGKKAGEGITVRLTDLLKRFEISEDLLNKLDESPLTGKNFSIQKIGKDVEFIFDEGFKPMSFKGLKVAVKETPKINLKQKEVAVKPEIETIPKKPEPLVEKGGGLIKGEILRGSIPDNSGNLKHAGDWEVISESPTQIKLKLIKEPETIWGKITDLNEKVGNIITIKKDRWGFEKFNDKEFVFYPYRSGTPLSFEPIKTSAGETLEVKPEVKAVKPVIVKQLKIEPSPIVKRETTEIVPKFTPQEIPPVKEPRVFYQSETGQAIPEDELSYVFFRKKLEQMPEGPEKERASEILKRAEELRQRTKRIIEETPEIKEEKLLGGLWDKIGLTNIVNKVDEKLHRAGITSFAFKGDPELDKETRTVTQLILNEVKNNIEHYTNVARKQASEILERRITDDELVSLIRNDIERVAELQQKQATKIKLGKEFFTETGELNKEFVEKLKNSVKEVGNEIQAQIISHNLILDDLEAMGADKEAVEKARLASNEAIWENLGSYLRTTYNRDLMATVLGGEKLYRPILFEYANYTPSQKEKLSLMEWAQGYLAKLKEEELNPADYIPEHLREGVLSGKKEDLEALGQIVKEMAGYETGIEGITKTMNYLATNYYNLATQMLILKNRELVSDVPMEGFVKVVEKNFPALFGKYIRSDIYNDLLETARYQQKIPDFFNLYSSMWKYGMVVGRPAAWVRNFLYGFYAQQTFAGNSPLNPANWKHFAKGIDFIKYLADPRNASKEVKLFIENGGGGGSFLQEEVRGGILDYLEKHKGKPEDLSFYQNLFNSLVESGASFSQAYSTIDSLNKFILFTKRLAKGDTPEQAVLYTNKYLNNYALNPKLFRELSKNPIISMILPFISFTVANTPVILETLVNNPQRIALFVSPFLAYNTMLRLTDPEFYAQAEKQKPYYQKNNLLYLPISWDKETGKIYYVDVGLLFNIPIRTDLKEQAIETLRALGGSFVMPGGAIQPISTAISGKDIFGQDVDVPLGEGRLGALLKMAPGGLLLTEITELVKDFLGIPYSSSGKVRNKAESIINFLGFNIYHTLPNQLKKNINAYERELNDYKARVNSIYNSPEVPLDIKVKVLQDLRKKEFETNEKIKDLLRPVIKTEVNNYLKTNKIDLSSIPLIKDEEEKKPMISVKSGVPVSYRGIKLKIKLPKVSLKIPKREKAKTVKLPKIKPYVVSNR